MQNCHFVLCTKNFALLVSTAAYKNLYQAVDAGSAVYNISEQNVPLKQKKMPFWEASIL